MMFYDSLVHCIANCHLEILNIAIGIAKRNTLEVVFHRPCNQCYTFRYYYTEVMRLNLCQSVFMFDDLLQWSVLYMAIYEL